jgi:putative transposase
VLEVLHHPDHVGEGTATVYAKLLDEGKYLASTSTMYRLARANAEVREYDRPSWRGRAFLAKPTALMPQ